MSTLKNYLSYKLDNVMSSNDTSLLFLAIVTIILTFVSGGFFFLMNTEQEISFFEASFKAWTFIADPGSHADEEGIGSRFAATVITFIGLFTFAIFIGIVGEVIETKLEALKKGKNKIIEEDHTLILGWSDKVFPFLKNIATANESEGGGVVVILAEGDKTEMEDLIEDVDFDLKGTKVLCRSGSSEYISDLLKVAADKAKSILIISDTFNRGGQDDGSARSIRTVLALVRGIPELKAHIAVDVLDTRNSELLQTIGDGHVVSVPAYQNIGRLLIQCSRQPGLADVYFDLLSFDGQEFYIKQWPSLVGKNFLEASFCFSGAIGVGVLTSEKEIIMNPPNDYIIEPEDQILVVAEDDSAYGVSDSALAAFDQAPSAEHIHDHEPNRVFFCGQRQDLGDLLNQLNQFVAPGTTAYILDENAPLYRAKDYSNISVEHHIGSTQNRDLLEEILSQNDFDIILIVSPSGQVATRKESMKADSRVLVSTLFIRDILEREGSDDKISVISEIQDPNTKSLANLRKSTSWVISNELIAMLLSQVCEQRENMGIWEELLTADGNEIYLRDCIHYLNYDGEQISFWELYYRGRKLNESIIGYEHQGILNLNPVNKEERISFTSQDFRIVTIAQD